MCPLPYGIAESAKQHLSDLAKSKGDLWTALETLPLTSPDAAILLRAQQYGVGCEATALLSIKEAGQWKGKTDLTFEMILDTLAKHPYTKGDVGPIKRPRIARALFKDLQGDHQPNRDCDRT